MNETDVRVMGRASRGVRGIRLDDNDELTAMLPVSKEEKMLLVSENGYGKRVEFDNFNNHRRGTGGQVIYIPDDKTGELIASITVRDDDDVMVITSQGKTIKFHANDVSIQGKGARGVRIVNIDKPDFVIGMDKIVPDEDEAALAAAKIAHDALEMAQKDKEPSHEPEAVLPNTEEPFPNEESDEVDPNEGQKDISEE
jgi:DNA gyrase subunit A